MLLVMYMWIVKVSSDFLAKKVNKNIALISMSFDQILQFPAKCGVASFRRRFGVGISKPVSGLGGVLSAGRRERKIISQKRA